MNYRAELVGVFGDPVDDNPTCVIEEAAFKELGLNWRYLTVKVLPEDLDTAMKAVKAFSMRGINLTMPHKIKVLPMLDELSKAAGIIGAVNTVINDNGRLIGENTDGKGFTIALKNSGVDITGANILILGAGGAARAIAVEAALGGASRVDIVNRTEKNGRELSALIAAQTDAKSEYKPWTSGLAVPDGTDILINATSIGFMPYPDTRPDIDYDTIKPGLKVSDVVFNPVEPLFLKSAAERGADTVSGLGMLVSQGAMNFTLWTGLKAPIEVMTEALKKEFA